MGLPVAVSPGDLVLSTRVVGLLSDVSIFDPVSGPDRETRIGGWPVGGRCSQGGIENRPIYPDRLLDAGSSLHGIVAGSVDPVILVANGRRIGG